MDKKEYEEMLKWQKNIDLRLEILEVGHNMEYLRSQYQARKLATLERELWE